MHESETTRRRHDYVLWTLWVIFVLVFTVLMWGVDEQFRDADSKLYSNIAQTIAREPVIEWFTPQWSGFWDRKGLFQEHPPGVFWVSASLIRIGTPPQQAAAVANLLYYLLIFYFVYKLGRYLGGSSLGWAMVWASFLIPVTLQYLIRANLEPPLTMVTVMGMYAFLRADRSRLAQTGFAVALTAAVFFKGMQGVIVAIFAGVYWIFWARDRQRFLTLIFGLLCLLVVCSLYEWIYRIRTGGDFWFTYMAIQAGIAVKSLSPWSKLYNLIWYIGRILYFALPWSLFLAVMRWWPRRRDDNGYILSREVVWRWLLLSAAVLVLIMAFFERKADRYVFPAYTFIAMAGGWDVRERFPRVRAWLERPARPMTLAFAASLMVAILLKTFVGKFFYHTVQFWRN